MAAPQAIVVESTAPQQTGVVLQPAAFQLNDENLRRNQKTVKGLEQRWANFLVGGPH